MKRSTYLQAFKEGLYIFIESFQQNKVLELDEKITKLVESGKTEEEAISSLGKVEDLILDVFKENNIDYSHIRDQKNKIVIGYEHFFEVIRHVINVMSKNSAKANGKILFDILILIFLTCVIKIPFILVRDLGVSLLSFIASPIINNIWSLIIEIIYLIFAVTFFLNVFKKWFQTLKIEK